MSAPGSIILRYITAMVIVGIAVLTAATSYNIWKEIGQVAPFDRSWLPGRAKVFTEIDHAAAAKEFGLDMRPAYGHSVRKSEARSPPWSRCHC